MGEPIWEEVELPAYDAICEAIRAYAVTLESGAQYTIASLKGEKECRERQLKAALAANREKDAEIERLNQLDAVVLLWRAEKAEAELSSLRASVGGEKWIDVKQGLPPFKKSSADNLRGTFGKEYLIFPPAWGSHTAFYGTRASTEPHFYIHGSVVKVTHYREIPAPPTKDKE